jgi:hypothetical protein
MFMNEQPLHSACEVAMPQLGSAASRGTPSTACDFLRFPSMVALSNVMMHSIGLCSHSCVRRVKIVCPVIPWITNGHVSEREVSMKYLTTAAVVAAAVLA